MSPLYSILSALVTVVAIVGFYLLAAYIVHTTGTTSGIADIGRSVGAIIAALTGRHFP